MNYLKSLCVVTALSVTMYSCKKEDMIYTPATTPSHQDNRMMKEIDKMMNKMDSTDMKGDPDTHFAKMMKVHHQGAIDMSKIIISEGKDPFIKNMADKMIQNQTKEIARLDSFLTNHT